MPIKLVVFDLAGTTVADNNDVHKVLKAALAANDVVISIEDANEVMGIPKPVAIRQLLERRYSGTREITEAWIDEIHSFFVAEMIRFYKEDPAVTEKEGVSETFKELKKRNYLIGIDTGFDRTITSAILDRLDWMREGLIDVSVTSDEVPRGRPFPDLIYRAMELTGIKDASEIAKVGDTASDMQEGTSAGCGLVIGVTSGAFSREQMLKERHSYLIHQISEILEILKG